MVVVAALLEASVRADASAPPLIHHEPRRCTVAGQPIGVCAIMTANKGIVGARIYFRRAGEKFFSYVEMSFSPVGYCGTLPAPLAGKTPTIEYYLEENDNEDQSRRSEPYPVEVKDPGACPSTPQEKDPAYHGKIKVFATEVKQGRRLPKGFDPAGVTFVAATSASKK
jgi:hypothetical protein